MEQNLPVDKEFFLFKFPGYPNAVRQLREEKGYSQLWFAKHAGISLTSLKKVEIIENGSENWKWDCGFLYNYVAEKITKALGEPIETVFPSYSKAKESALPRAIRFYSVEERNAAIEKVFPKVKSQIKRYKKDYPSLSEDEIEDIAINTLWKIANKGMSPLLPQDCEFEHYVLSAIRKELLTELKKMNRQAFSLDSFQDDTENGREYDPIVSKQVKQGTVPDTTYQEYVCKEEYQDLVPKHLRYLQWHRFQYP